MIKAQGIVKKFGTFCALDGFDMHVKKGSIYGLVGPNGAGKTTIINHLTGVFKPDSGIVTIDSNPIWENPSLKQRVLSIADDWYYYGTYTINDMADFYRSMYMRFDNDRYKKTRRIL